MRSQFQFPPNIQSKISQIFKDIQHTQFKLSVGLIVLLYYLFSFHQRQQHRKVIKKCLFIRKCRNATKHCAVSLPVCRLTAISRFVPQQNAIRSSFYRQHRYPACHAFPVSSRSFIRLHIILLTHPRLVGWYHVTNYFLFHSASKYPQLNTAM